MSHSIIRKAKVSMKWSALMEMVAHTASPIIYVILARLLTPEDFGLVATAMLAITFSQMFWDAGLSKALIQTKESVEDAANIVFWTNLCLGSLIYALLFLAAPRIADFFHSPAIGPVLRVLGLQVVLGSLTSVQQALLVRDLGFRQLFWVKLLTVVIPGCFAIILAFWGYGVWALVAGSLGGSLLNTVLLWHKSSWRPRKVFEWPLFRKLFHFGYWVIGESLAAWFIATGDNLVVGYYLGAAKLGVYSLGWSICTIIFSFLLNPFLPVLYPTFSRLQDDPVALKDTFHKVNRIVISIALPASTGLLLLGPQLAAAVFGDKWQGLGLVLSLIGFMHGAGRWVVGVNPELYRALGRPDINTKLMFVYLLYIIPAYLLAAPQGLEVFTSVRLGVALVAMPISAYVCARILGVSPLYLWHTGKSMFWATLVMAGWVSALKILLPVGHSSGSVLVYLATLIISGALVYVGSLWVLDREFILQILKLNRAIYRFYNNLRFAGTYARFALKNNLKYFKIATHLTKSEKLLLYKLALSLKDNSIIVEIGSYLGASSSFLASAANEKKHQVFCVDTWKNDAMSEGSRDTYEEFICNTKELSEVITPLRGSSEDISKDFSKNIDLLFIDGDHSYEGVKSDILFWLPKVKHSGMVVFHDFGWAEGVQKAVREFIEPIRIEDHIFDNMYWARISSDMNRS